jgi:hypothetical protein
MLEVVIAMENNFDWRFRMGVDTPVKVAKEAARVVFGLVSGAIMNDVGAIVASGVLGAGFYTFANGIPRGFIEGMRYTI